jgi:hypothetical protein
MKIASTTCANCSASLAQVFDRCLTCGFDAGAPNVRDATTGAEASALEARYSEAVLRAEARGANDNRLAFERALGNSGVVVNCTLPYLRDFVTDPKMLYANYHQLVQGEVRKAALSERDQQRTVVDSILFRSYARFIRFGALSLSDRGLTSYGPYTLGLKTITVAHRSSVLEENAFVFVERHKLGAKTPIPSGYRSDWEHRSMLAVAKLEPYLDVGIQIAGFAKLLLQSEGDYATDKFMEVHIFGPFDFGAIESVSGPMPKKAMDIAIWESVKEEMIAAGKRVDEW